jgi:hypothetical protein
MATCPRCGKTVNQKIYVPISETNKGYKDVECSCGYIIRYEVEGYREEQIRKINEKIAEEKAIIEAKTVVEPYKNGYTWFANVFIICTTVIVLFFSVSIWNKIGIAVGITMITGNSLLIWLGTVFVYKRLKYFENDGTIIFEYLDNEYIMSRSKTVQRRLVPIRRFFGFVIYLIAIGMSYYCYTMSYYYL